MENDIKTITNDPYLNTARLTIKNKRYRDLYIKKRIDRNFLKKKIDIDEYIFMSKGVSTVTIWSNIYISAISSWKLYLYSYL